MRVFRIQFLFNLGGFRYLPETVVEDLWDDAGQERAADLKAWVGIDFNQVEAEVFIKHEVVTE